MEQIVMNLAVNARDAMPDGGRLLIEVREVDAGPGADARPEGAAGGSVELSVRDEGTGMTPEVKSRIFEPFFTTKEPGRGTGLGLATVYGIVQQSGGQISVDSEPGRGSRFAISLPRVAPDAPAAAALEPPRGAVGRTGRNAVLLVEDDDLLRELIRELLENAGYQVRAARRPSDALDPAVPGAPVDLLLLDVVLPEMSGPELAARLRQRHPLARVLYMSGYATESVAQHLQAGTPHLKKPFQPAELLERIEEVLKD
jgi:CheY-like chemotaxis protein